MKKHEHEEHEHEELEHEEHDVLEELHELHDAIEAEYVGSFPNEVLPCDTAISCIASEMLEYVLSNDASYPA